MRRAAPASFYTRERKYQAMPLIDIRHLIYKRSVEMHPPVDRNLLGLSAEMIKLLLHLGNEVLPFDLIL